MPDVGLNREVTIMDGNAPYAAINNTGVSSLVLHLGDEGFGDLVLELEIEASGAVGPDTLECKWLPLQMGTDSTFLTEPIEEVVREPIAPNVERCPMTWSMANVTGASAKFHLMFHDVWAKQLKLFCASSGANDTWKVIAKVQRMKRVPYTVSH